MTLNAEIKFIKQPQVGDYIEFDLRSDGISSYNTPVKIVFNNTATPTTLGESKIGVNILDTVSILRLKLFTYYRTTNDSSVINFSYLLDTLGITYNTSATPGYNGYASIVFNSEPSVGTLVDVKSYIWNNITSISKLIGVSSPYFVIYNNSSNPYDKIQLDLFIWTGDMSSKPNVPSYQFIKYKTSYDDVITYINISNIVKGFLNPKLTNDWTAGNSLSSVFNESCFVQWNVYGLQDRLNIDGDPTGENIFISSFSELNVATLGYSYFNEGPNYYLSTTNVLSDKVDFLNLGDDEYTTIFNGGATSTGQTILRTKLTDRGVCEAKYKPYQVVYLNKNGVFVGFSFTKMSKKMINSKTDSFERLLNKPYVYSTIEHSSRVLNKTEKLSYTLNTTSLSEVDVKHIKELIQSEKHYLIVDNKIIPVILKDNEFEVKNSVNNKAKIQYTLVFDEANELKNNIN